MLRPESFAYQRWRLRRVRCRETGRLGTVVYGLRGQGPAGKDWKRVLWDDRISVTLVLAKQIEPISAQRR